MVSGASATYAYNSQGLRTSKTVGNETDYFVLVSGNVWNDGTTDYLRGIELISNGSQLYLYNIRGDVIQLTDLAGNVTKTYNYDAYGNELTRDLNDENPFRYCGEYYDTETGFIYLRARYYDPLTGRFAAMDTHWNPSNAIYGDNPVKTSRAEDCKSFYPNLQAINQSTNLYVYCGNNPVKFADKNGEWLHLVIGAGVGALAGIVGQVLSDVVTSALNGEITISNWQTYVGAAVGGAAGGLVLSATGNVAAANFVSGALTTGVGQTLEKLTIDNYDKSWAEVGANAVFDGSVSFMLGKLPGINKVTAGRNSFSAVYKSGLTKLRNNVAQMMSTRVIYKGIVSNVVGGFALDAYYGVKQFSYDKMKQLILYKV